MTDAQYAEDCIAFLRELAERIRYGPLGGVADDDDADKLDEIATSLQLGSLEGES
jgi:hypothetical protein